ncbi:MAG: acylphosphatase [Patescibacteria group bacterium]|nr:acylphosphatase [Patescibacteria group bacterium]
MKKQLNITIIGNVQGVFYRVNAKEFADNNNLSGWIKNEGDGTVKISAEGEERDLKKLITWCEKESPGKTLQIEEKWGKNKNAYNKFEIKY